MSPIRVTHLYKTAYPLSYGGVETFIHQLITSMPCDKIQHRVVTTGETQKKITSLEYFMDIHPITYAVSSCPFSYSLWQNYSKILKDTDVIHYHSPWPFSALCDVFKNTKKIPSIVTYHSDIIKQRILKYPYKPIEHRFYRNVQKIVATSEQYAKTSPLLKKFHSKVSVIPLGIASNLTKIQNMKLPSQYVLFLGVLRYYKGLHVLINAIKGLDIPLMIAGDGPELFALKKLANDNQNIHFLGQVTEEEKNTLLQQATLVVLPSIYRSEAFGVCLLEAMLHQKPLITTELGTGTSYVNQHEVTGLVVAPNDEGALKKAIQKIFYDKALQSRYGKAAYERYEQYFTMTNIAKQYQSLYEKILEEK